LNTLVVILEMVYKLFIIIKIFYFFYCYFIEIILFFYNSLKNDKFKTSSKLQHRTSVHIFWYSTASCLYRGCFAIEGGCMYVSVSSREKGGENSKWLISLPYYISTCAVFLKGNSYYYIFFIFYYRYLKKYEYSIFL
jgi:hypothetical protein